jgi:hypothetical protein
VEKDLTACARLTILDAPDSLSRQQHTSARPRFFVDSRKIKLFSRQFITRTRPTIYGYLGQEEANARLIASAPDLLTALQQLVKVACQWSPVEKSPAIVEAKKAIAKATA